MEHREDIRPPRFNVVALGRQCVIVKHLKTFHDWHLHMNHVGDTSDHHVSDCAALVVLHYVLKRPGSQDFQNVCWKSILYWKSHLRKSFWKWKFDNSPFWMNFWANCLRNDYMHYALHCRRHQSTELILSLAISKT